MMKFVLIGHGKMGQLIERTITDAGDQVIGVFDEFNFDDLQSCERADVVMDFSRPAALDAISEYVQRTGTPLLSGTTGHTAGGLSRLQSLGAYAPVLWSANYSLGIAVFRRMLAMVSDTLKPTFDIEITETHHNQKTDAPSGTAKLLLQTIDPTGEYTPVYGREGDCGKRDAKEIGVHALRGGTEAGTHSVHFFGVDEELEITHRATSRQIFVNGAIHAARLLAGKPKGVYTLDQLLFPETTEGGTV